MSKPHRLLSAWDTFSLVKVQPGLTNNHEQINAILILLHDKIKVVFFAIIIIVRIILITTVQEVNALNNLEKVNVTFSRFLGIPADKLNSIVVFINSAKVLHLIFHGTEFTVVFMTDG